MSGRQTAFPQIVVEEIEVNVGDTGVVTEFGEGLPEDITPDFIEDITDLLPLFGDSSVESQLVYTLLIGAAAKQPAKSKARGFTRVKNPFEPDIIEILSVERLEGFGRGEVNGVMPMFRVKTRVKK